MGVVPNVVFCQPVPGKKFSSRASQGSNESASMCIAHPGKPGDMPRNGFANQIIRGNFIAHYLALYHITTLSRSMSANRRKKSSPSQSALATSQPTQQLSPPQLLPSTPESQSHSSQQQQQAQPNHPWSVLRPTSRSKGVLSSTSRPPFHRHGHTLSITAAGELLFFGGVAHDSLRNDLYVFSMRDRSVTFFQTSGEVPSPRSFSASVLVSNVLLIFGGTTNMDNRGFSTGPFDDSLYLLSLGTLNLLMLRPNLAD